MGRRKFKPTQPDIADDELLDAAIAANLKAASMVELELIAPGQFAEEEFPGLKSSCALCGVHSTDTPCTSCNAARYCSIECRKTAWKLQHKTSCGQPWPTPLRLARSDLPEVVDVLREFGRANAPLADLCLLRLSMSLSKEGKKLRLHMPDSANVASTTATLRSLASEAPRFLEAVFSTMTAHRSDACVQTTALALLTSISGVGGSPDDVGQEAASEVLAQAGAFVHLVGAMLSHPQDARVQAGGCCVLSATCRGADHDAAARRDLALEAGVLPAVLKSLTIADVPSLRGGKVRESDARMRTEADAFMRNEACAALIHLCESEAWCDAAAGGGAFPLICSLMASQQQDVDLLRHGCGLLDKMCAGEGKRAEVRRSTACGHGAIAAVCALREAVGPVKRAARNALQTICTSDSARWREAGLAGAPRSWLLS